MTNVVSPHTAAALRPLTCSILLALAGLSPFALNARDLNNESETVSEDDVPEAWRLTNDARLEVDKGSTLTLVATDSAIRLEEATVTRGTGDAYAVELHGSSRLTGGDSRIEDGGILLRDTALAILRDSEISVTAGTPGVRNVGTIGVRLESDRDADTPRLTLNNTRIRVEDAPGQDPYTSGIGIFQGAGRVTLAQRTEIQADNVGVLMRGEGTHTQPISLVLDKVVIRSGRGAAVQVAPGDGARNAYDITVANGSTLRAGNDVVLYVGRLPGTGATGETTVFFNVDDSVLVGDVIFDPQTVTGTLDVSLYNDALLVGRMLDVNHVGLIGGAQWYMNGDSRVRSLQISGGGTVYVGVGEGFNTLTVGTFEGRQGTLVFNTVLGADDAQTDRLVVTGDASGEAGVEVRNAGGQGGQTDRGIELIHIQGASNAVFTLLGRAVGGQYEYFLVKDANGSWYLRSQREEPELPHECVTDPTLPQCEVTLPVEPGDPTDPVNPDPEDPADPDPEHPDPEHPDPERPDPEDPTPPTPVLRPETGAYLANHAAMGQLLQHSARERMAAAAAVDGLRTWAATGHREGRIEVTGQQTLRTAQSRLQVGADIGAFDGGKGRVGAMLTAGQSDATSRSTVTGYRADARVEGGAAGLYAHWTDNAVYLDASVQRGQFRNRVMGEGVAVERYDSGLWQTTLEAGYRFNAGRLGGMALHVEPQLQLTHSAVRMDTHVEHNGTVVARAGGNGLATRLGLRVEGEVPTAGTHITPYLQLDAHHDARKAAMTFDGESVEGGMPDRRVAFNLGGQVQFGSGLAVWGGLGASQGSDGYREASAQVGVLYRW